MTSQLNRRALLQAAFAPCAAALGQPLQQSARPRPNVLVFLSDDQGWGDLSLNGNTNLSTPNIDALARDGARFNHFYVAPVCAPTRAEFLTGRYHGRCGVSGVSTGLERLNLDEATIAGYFHAAGYATGAFGKWHNGSQPPYHPNHRGFDEFYGMTHGHWGHYFDYDIDHNGRMTKGKGYVIDDLTNHAIRFIGRNRNKPFFCYVPFNSPHSPMQVPDRFYRKFAGVDPKLRGTNANAEELGHTRAALAMCENIDWNVGRVLARLDEWNLTRDTIVLYFCDNGPNGWRWNGGMKGRKGSVDEGGVRSPLLIRYPRGIRAGTRVEPIAAAIDLMPTLTSLCGVPAKSLKPLDGLDLSPLLTGAAASAPDRMIFTKWAKRSSVRTQQYRLDNEGRLHDIAADPNQLRDIAAAQPGIAKRLGDALRQWNAEMDAAPSAAGRPFPVGHANTTWLPARDAEPHGGIRPSNLAPNDSYFTNWKSKQDTITWDVEILTAATYSVDLYYTCPKSAVGANVQIQFGQSKTAARIATANDPPLIGAKEDRHDRGQESFVKDFKPLRLGRFHLDKGRGPLTLQATDIPGTEVADIKYVVLTR